MIRVGFIISLTNQSWLGGLNYFRNLLSAIHSLPDRKIEPVIFTGCQADLTLSKGFPPIEIIQTPLLDRKHPQWLLRKSWAKLLSHDLFLEKLFLKQHITLLSHSISLGKQAKIPTIGWIPDFQHTYLPEFFSKKEIHSRNRQFRNMLHSCSYIIVSSKAAKQDLIKFDSSSGFKASVLQFVSDFGTLTNPPNLDYLEKSYKFQGLYFHLPNQFWAHKNHRVVIEALKILKARNQKVLVLVTGNTKDYRQLNYFPSLMKYAEESDVLDCFRVLGIIPYSDLVALMTNSISLINPSLFEGWSTTVEEAKSLGKQIILSDIAVHREQAPERGEFFDPRNAESLAEIMWKVWSSWDMDTDRQFMHKARETLLKRKLEFAKNYQDIVMSVISQAN
ncbi:MAG: hypothetical protein BWK78_07505 [Thiotrichaceae bacterium IS1]|nr:MAG: hypothetical protein BWK78_07505 [Thiotrichaceae bacterium IS1]